MTVAFEEKTGRAGAQSNQAQNERFPISTRF